MLGLTAEQLGSVILAISLTIITLMGGKKGREMAQGQKPATGKNVIEVAGAIVSDKAVAEWVKSNDATTSAITVLTRSIDRNTQAVESVERATRAALDEMRVLTREAIRLQAHDHRGRD